MATIRTDDITQHRTIKRDRYFTVGHIFAWNFISRQAYSLHN